MCSAIAVFLALQFHIAAFVDGEYIPVGNDSFYHARRILDAAIGERGFYQFDEMIHAPEGSLLTWPWAYDYLIAKALQLALLLEPALDPMKFVANVPVFWVIVNVGLLTLLTRELGLAVEWRVAAVLALALSPLTQLLHGQGIIDHHFIEMTFTLLAAWLGVRFLNEPENRASATILGVALGTAPAFHASLFILQMPLVAALFIWWVKGGSIPVRSQKSLATSLVLATAAILSVSEPVHRGQFNFTTLSWFHLYAAAGTCLVTCLFSAYTYTVRRLIWLAGVVLLFVAPLVPTLMAAKGFMAGQTIGLERIEEVRSPFSMLIRENGLIRTLGLYGLVLLAAPVLLLAFLFRSLRGRSPAEIYFAVSCVFGLSLALLQFRFHPFAAAAFSAGPAVLLSPILARLPLRRGLAAAVVITGVFIAFAIPLTEQLFARHAVGLDPHYANTRKIYNTLSKACQQDPGVVLADSNDGHYIRFHTDCSVIVNNFLLTAQHGQKLSQARQLMRLRPAQLLDHELPIKYVFSRLEYVYTKDDGVGRATTLEEIASANPPLFLELAFSEPPKGFELLDEIRLEDRRDLGYARLFQLVPNKARSTGRIEKWN
ncbi:hypothetical protein [Lentisalinibacter sediminis]|uniref:hypothetical protein n=1 Tax=Lentisalinibacter sediminis TaxID=2992237 RepID=UPI00386BE43D